MDEEVHKKFERYGTLVTVASLILIVVYASGAYDGWDALISLMGLWFGGYYLWKKAQFDWPSQFLASLISSCSLVLLWKSAVSITNHYKSTEVLQKCEPLSYPSSTGGVSESLIVALVIAGVLTLLLGKPNEKMTEHHNDSSKDRSKADISQPPSNSELWNQLGNTVTLIAKQDQLVWAIFGVFWAANAVLLVALFTDGDIPKRPVGLVVSLVSIVLSIVWLLIQHRALAWLSYYESILRCLEKQHLHVPQDVAFTGNPRTVEGVRARPLMLACPPIFLVSWGGACLWFLARP